MAVAHKSRAVAGAKHAFCFTHDLAGSDSDNSNNSSSSSNNNDINDDSSKLAWAQAN